MLSMRERADDIKALAYLCQQNKKKKKKKKSTIRKKCVEDRNTGGE